MVVRQCMDEGQQNERKRHRKSKEIRQCKKVLCDNVFDYLSQKHYRIRPFYIGAVSLLGGVQLGFWLWLGIAAPLQLGMVLWEGKPVKLYLINTGHTLFNLVLVCAVLAVWA